MEIIKSFISGIIKIYSNDPEFLLKTILLLALGILLKIYYPKFRGFMGEFWVKIDLNKLAKNKYIVLNDIMIRDKRGTHQIDHIVVSEFGIFVIEMKNYNGLIIGKEFDSKWCQRLGKIKNYFMNPIHQNYGHIKALSDLLKLDEKYFISIVCFSNQAKINVKSNSIVTQTEYLKNIILKYETSIVESDISKLCSIIKQHNIIDKDIRHQHVKDIRTKIAYDKKLANNMICPKCGSNLIEKSGKRGKFIGCSNYPKCKYIKK